MQNTIGAVGETEIRWLGTSAASEVLVIDGLVVRPGAESFSVKGGLARSPPRGPRPAAGGILEG